MNVAVRTVDAPKPGGFYSQGIRNAGLLFVSGQLPLAINGDLVAGDIGAQTRRALENVLAIVEGAGGNLSSIAQVTIYVADIALWSDVNRVYAEFFALADVPPARAVVPVTTLHYGALIEIQAIACLASGTARY